MTANLTMYGAMWCKDCRRSRSLLERHGVDFVDVDLEAEPDRVEEARTIAGRQNIPVIVFADGTVLVEPSDDDLEAALVAHDLVTVN